MCFSIGFLCCDFWARIPKGKHSEAKSFSSCVQTALNLVSFRYRNIIMWHKYAGCLLSCSTSVELCACTATENPPCCASLLSVSSVWKYVNFSALWISQLGGFSVLIGCMTFSTAESILYYTSVSFSGYSTAIGSLSSLFSITKALVILLISLPWFP